MKLDGAHVLVTGASRGIGAAMAQRFAAAGARVSVAARSANDLEALAREIDGTPFTIDLLDVDAVDTFIATVEEQVGPIDVLVNNAGLASTAFLHNLDPEMIRATARLNLETPMVLTRNVLPGMLQRGRGHLVYTASLAGTGGFPGLTSYGATKAGLLNFVAALRMELKDTSLKTTVVAPGPIDTDMWEQVEQEPGLEPMLRRLGRLQLIPSKSTDYIAKRTVAAVEAEKRHVRTPRRLVTSFLLREAPTRITEAVLTGVPTGPRTD